MIAAGLYHSAALRLDGSVIAWGDNHRGQTTVPLSAQGGVLAIAANSWHTVALKQDGSVVAWGDNGFGESAIPPKQQAE
jgi:alpha-tubulin suppressor-like RCC1 family protein